MAITNIKYHSTNQFRNVVKNIKHQAQYKGLDSEGVPIMDRTAVAPTLRYIGTVKLHGTNASIIEHEDGTVSFHSKAKLLGYVKGGEFTLNSDNSEFAQSMFRRFEGVKHIMRRAKAESQNIYGEVIYPIKVSGEFVGQGIQKGVGIAFLPKKSFFIFGLKLGETDQELKQGWVPVTQTETLQSNDHSIYSIMQFDTKLVDINFNEPEYAQNFLVDCTNEVEECCPVSKALGITESLLGEGLVWTPVAPAYAYDSGNWFKSKGTKHSVSKTKSVVAIDPEKLNSIKEFVEYSVTDNRLLQGVSEVGLDQKLIGTFIGWINRDINKEEGDVLEASSLSMKDVGKNISNKARVFYLEELNNSF